MEGDEDGSQWKRNKWRIMQEDERVESNGIKKVMERRIRRKG